jgi:predicted ATPase with chaperone activity
MVAAPMLTGVVNEADAPFAPPRPASVEDLGLDPGFVSDLALKTVYFNGVITGGAIASSLRLPYNNVVDRILEALKAHALVEVRGGTGPLSVGYRYALTNKGAEKVRELLDRSQYAGPCPVTFDDYCEAVARQSIKDVVVTREAVNRAFERMVLSPRVIDQLGPAINSGKSLFLFGPPGNGKTTIAEVAATLLGGHIYIPHAVLMDGQVVRVFDEVHHRAVADPAEESVDARWLRSRRPVVIAGGELTLETLELGYQEEARVYEAPLQMKANCGMFLIDDFGRQKAQPIDLLNRWIVPLEKRADYLTLANGTKVKVPFDELIVFSTNQRPADLCDMAFLRRIRYKIEIGAPTNEEYREIFQRNCEVKGIEFNEAAVVYILSEYYHKKELDIASCHPRDILDQLIDIARYLGVRPMLAKDLIDLACNSYFVKL